MRTFTKKLALLTLALLSVGASLQAATETYDFSTLSTGQYTESGTTSCDKVNSQNMNLLKIGTETFNNRFAVSRAGTATANNAWETKAYSTHSGLFACWDGRYFTILGLHNGDKINIVWSTESSNGASLKFYDQPALSGVSSGAIVTSGSDYTVETDAESVNINLVTDKGSETNGNGTKVYIKSVTIETSSVSVPVTINVIPDASVEEYDFQDFAYKLGSDANNFTLGSASITNGAERTVKAISYVEESFGNRFALNKDAAGFKLRYHTNKAYDGIIYNQKWTDIYFSVLDLKNGDKIKFEGTNISQLAFDGTPALLKNGVAVNSSDALEAGIFYTVSTAASSVTLDFVTKDCSSTNLYIHKITIDPAAANVGNYIGATLVSQYALDFTDVNDITAYVATSASEGSVTFSKVTKVAANTPLYIKANETSGAVLNVNVPEAEDGAVDYSSTNLLRGSASSPSGTLTSDATTCYYVYGVKNSVAGFYKANGFTSAAGKAYLELTATQAAASARLALNFSDDEATAIEGTKNAVVESEAWYTLQGVRVATPTKGIYVKNGKKVIVK